MNASDVTDKTTDKVTNKLKTFDLSKARHQLVTIPAYWLVIALFIGWAGKPYITDFLSDVFLSRAEADGHIEEADKQFKKMNKFMGRAQLSDAVQAWRGIRDDLDRHNLKSPDIPDWLFDKRDLEDQLTAAESYKKCLEVEIRKPEPAECDLLW